MTSGDPLPSLRGSPQPALDLVEVGEELQEERSEIVGREDTVEIKEALVDIMVREWRWRVRRGKRQGEVFCMRQERTWHFSDSVLGFQESSSAEYPFHRIRNDRLVGVPRWRRIFTISYSFSPLIRSGGGEGKLGLWTAFLR